MERHNVQCIICVLYTKLSEVIVLKCKASMSHFQFGLISIREYDLSDLCREVFVGNWRVGVPLGLCMMSWLVWATLVVTWPCCAQAAPGPQPWPCWRSAQGRGGCCCSAKSHLRGKGRSWCCALYGMLGRTECVVRKASSWYCLGIICIGHLGAKIRGENGFHFYSRSLKLYRDYVTVFMLTSDFFFLL